MDITRENLVVLQKKGFTAKEMAQNFGCSQSLIYTKLQTFELQQRKKYSSISHDELLEVVSRIHKDFPAAGEKVRKKYTEYTCRKSKIYYLLNVIYLHCTCIITTVHLVRRVASCQVYRCGSVDQTRQEAS